MMIVDRVWEISSEERVLVSQDEEEEQDVPD